MPGHHWAERLQNAADTPTAHSTATQPAARWRPVTQYPLLFLLFPTQSGRTVSVRLARASPLASPARCHFSDVLLIAPQGSGQDDSELRPTIGQISRRYCTSVCLDSR